MKIEKLIEILDKEEVRGQVAADAAAYAAKAAEKEWQFKRLKHYLGVA
jgi:hypothetical protein